MFILIGDINNIITSSSNSSNMYIDGGGRSGTRSGLIGAVNNVEVICSM